MQFGVRQVAGLSSRLSSLQYAVRRCPAPREGSPAHLKRNGAGDGGKQSDLRCGIAALRHVRCLSPRPFSPGPF
eukprot:4387874-Alexandrium_andersonii.AAC.2